MKPALFLAFSALFLYGCSHDQKGIEVRTVEVPVIEQRPCPGEIPKRPDPLGPLPTDAVKLAATLAAKLVEYSGAGGYADRADAWMQRCAGE